VNLTRLFVRGPTLVFVLVALMLFAGVISTMQIVKQLFPNVSQPTVSISVSYNGRVGDRDARQHRRADRTKPCGYEQPADVQLDDPTGPRDDPPPIRSIPTSQPISR